MCAMENFEWKVGTMDTLGITSKICVCNVVVLDLGWPERQIRTTMIAFRAARQNLEKLALVAQWPSNHNMYSASCIFGMCKQSQRQDCIVNQQKGKV